jgi:uncharacterized protein with GYD domain
MATFVYFLNWTDQGAKTAKDVNRPYQASTELAESPMGNFS